MMESRVEQKAIERSGQRLRYAPDEKIGVIVVRSFPELGTLTAMRFLEWVQAHPEGVISLPTGRSPEHFIKEVGRLLAGWETAAVRAELEDWGVDPARRPSLQGLRFVQIDEFYPIDPRHHNSFIHYVREFYLRGFGLDPARALLIDCSEIGLPPGRTLEEVWPEGEVDISLRNRPGRTSLERLQKQVIENIDQWCGEYERRVRELGGIGFFLGGIGPDGHIGFNIRGSDHFSTTRLTYTNYETQAAAATDLGGIEVARRRLVITIGLSTITFNPACAAIIMAAGEAKAEIAADSIRHDPHVHYPATALQVLPAARFYLTAGAARQLRQRQSELFVRAETISEENLERAVIDLALRLEKRIVDLTPQELRADPFTAVLLDRTPYGAQELCRRVSDSLKSRIEAGTRTRSNTVFLHTEPHHDDLMLGYMPYIVRHIRDHSDRHYFATMTSGFTAVTHRYMLEQLRKLRQCLAAGTLAGPRPEGPAARTESGWMDYFDPSSAVYRNQDVWQYLDGVAAHSRTTREQGEMRRLLRNLVALYGERDLEILGRRVDELIDYFQTQYPGKRDPEHIQTLKGMCREWEADCLWGYFGWDSEHVRHLRLGFYQGAIFTEEPTLERDVKPILDLLREVRPDVVSLALDPEGSGPDTHYKVLQAVSEALRRFADGPGGREVQVLGYRNVWFRFHPAEANLFVPVSLNMFSLVQSAFLNTFISQKEASFPSPEHQGPFCELAQRIQVEQYRMMKTCLGREYFYEHPSALMRATRGLVFLKQMTLTELTERSRELRLSAENR